MTPTSTTTDPDPIDGAPTPFASPLGGDPTDVVAALRALLAVGAATAGAWPRALVELALVHRREQARLLVAASALLREQRALDEETPARTGDADRPDDDRSPRGWRARARVELAAARADGFEADWLLQLAVLRPRDPAVDAGALAARAVELGGGDGARIALALARTHG